MRKYLPISEVREGATPPFQAGIFNLAIVSLIVIPFISILACGESKPEINQGDISVFLNADSDPYQFELTSAQLDGNADILISYPAISHFAKDADPRVGIDRLPGRVIAHTSETVEFVFGKKNPDGDYFKAQILYPRDLDITDLHDNKDNVAACRFEDHKFKNKYGPIFVDCRQLN